MKLPDPLQQLSFATKLDSARDRVLLEALRQAAASVPTAKIDAELAANAPASALAKLAGLGIRGETYFPTPLILTAAPNLLGYYRLLYGFSQKRFYHPGNGCSVFRLMETAGKISPQAAPKLKVLCTAFAQAGEMLVSGLGSSMTNAFYPNELCILTLGAQFVGSANNARGTEGIQTVFAVLGAIFEAEIVRSEARLLEITSSAGRLVMVELAADPDILIKSRMADGQDRTVVVIEVKAGEDHSNIWNRIGEAEKSHIKARSSGVAECWTIINDPQAAEIQLHAQSPSTHRFYQLLDLTNDQSAARADFASRVRDMVGL